MKNWALMVAALYLGILAILTVPFAMLAFAPNVRLGNGFTVYVHWQYWLWLAVMAVSQFTLLVVPVRVASLRPVARGPIWRTVLATGLMAGGLAAGAVLSITEFMRLEAGGPHGDKIVGTTVAAGIITWCVWVLIFTRMSRDVPPGDLISRQCQWLFKGSVLELLIAVPTHIVARHRDYCCAGILTFMGLTMGISVMLFAFGPAVLILFVQRWKRLHPASSG